MKIRIEKTKIEKLNIEEEKERCGRALDELWKQEWVRRSVTGADKKSIDKIVSFARRIRQREKKVVVVTAGEIACTVKALAGLLPEDGDRPELLFCGDSLSPQAYRELLNAVDGDEFVLLGIAGKEDTLSLRGAYAALKQVLVSNYGIERAAEDIFFTVSDRDNYLAAEAERNDSPVLLYSKEIPELYAGCAEPALLVLSLFGMDICEYMDGFRDMLSSPAWDLDAADFALARAAMRGKGIRKENLVYWQKQFAGFTAWLREFSYGMELWTTEMPAEAGVQPEDRFDTCFAVEKEEADIMMPYFEGCCGDGSLNLLLNETAENYFLEETEKIPGVRISIERADAYNLGQLFAFVQLSNGVTEFLYNFV